MTRDHLSLGTPIVGEAELEAIADVFETGWVVGGPTVDEFEDRFAEYVGADHAVAVASATAGMDLVFRANEAFTDGDRVILPGQAFAADGLAVLQNGLQPLFVDVEEATANVDPDWIEHYAPDAAAVLPIHYAGLPARMDRIVEIADEHGLFVLEDAAHALGASWKDQPIGTIGDATVFSFGPLKPMTTGMGGMVTTNLEPLAERLRTLRRYGIDTPAAEREGATRPWRYEIPRLGHNYRLPDVAAAMGLAQLDRLDGFLAQRETLAAAYNGRLANQGVDAVTVPPYTPGRVYGYYTIRTADRDGLAAALMGANIGVSVHWDPPLHRHRLYRPVRGLLDAEPRPLPAADRLADELLTLPLHPEMDRDDVDRVCDVIEAYHSE